MSELPSFLGFEMNQNLTRLSYVETALCGFFSYVLIDDALNDQFM